MVRIVLALSALLLGACSQKAEAPSSPEGENAVASVGTATFAGSGRDRLCLADGGRGAFITFGEGNANCSVRGQVDGSGERLTLAPEGDLTCRIDIVRNGDDVRLGEVGGACNYYCGPKASFAGKTFKRMPNAEPVTDIAGDPLC
jgi:hypothetical protein